MERKPPLRLDECSTFVEVIQAEENRWAKTQK
jgi:hypothetical protein